MDPDPDMLAEGIRAQARGDEPGGGITVVGYNDIPTCEELMVPLTSVRSPLDEIGARAVEILLAATRGLLASWVAMKPELIVREITVPRRPRTHMARDELRGSPAAMKNGFIFRIGHYRNMLTAT
ncbi:substrate-binding domain-containing protein [Nocardia higoensis]|uniref:substrate-binding domain-containing protein n=1 Tax=Nocardia higoensis TaxID=228599 RepID=UPI0002EB03BC|nr:substrate-binding domain-containing protein [Nocardia higoensis]